MVRMAGNVEIASKVEGGGWGALTPSVRGRSACLDEQRAWRLDRVASGAVGPSDIAPLG